ncbi:uncharacterized protein PV07_09467 [Cladophialophora immunda]|uniref:GST C-terminal domain-containing protein n=1 Tax=Cladophialophora immunda TaxID=569365 RepID=A0A0D2AMP6_9EURO|nr:uncharacterized protein PV07_09467 [Cladophialophora immunda]KIW26367.1 hypothetical protein PV07_09467 [Cladophialophora immunda]
MEKNATELRASLAALLPDDPRQWIYNNKPTALDAHLVPFIARLTDVGWANLIPQKLREYASWAWQGHEWSTLMAGRTPMVPPR